MIRELEKKVLEKINFVERYITIYNRFQPKQNENLNLTKKEILDLLNRTNFLFQRKDNQYYTDINKNEYTFRLLFDVKNISVLTYIYVLKDGDFIDNGLSHFGYLLNFFNLEKYHINTNFALNNIQEFTEYISEMILIFDDFIREFIKNLER